LHFLKLVHLPHWTVMTGPLSPTLWMTRAGQALDRCRVYGALGLCSRMPIASTRGWSRI
jgi:hypothetical protein